MRTIGEIQEEYRKFVAERDWEKFHSPKNLASALSVEASELLEIFTWLKPDQPLNPERLQNAKDEMADVFLYLIRLADVLGVDLFQAVRDKFPRVIAKYPVDQAREVSRRIEA
jgi:NTP pyrophosphatase (non-canonical NTP hydrolase)